MNIFNIEERIKEQIRYRSDIIKALEDLTSTHELEIYEPDINILKKEMAELWDILESKVAPREKEKLLENFESNSGFPVKKEEFESIIEENSDNENTSLRPLNLFLTFRRVFITVFLLGMISLLITIFETLPVKETDLRGNQEHQVPFLIFPDSSGKNIDIGFIFDTTGSMPKDIERMQLQIQEFIEELQAEGFDYNYKGEKK